MIVGVPKESFPGERRVALIPAQIPELARAGIETLVESGAGAEAGFPDAAYVAKGGKIAPTRADVFSAAKIILQVRGLGANKANGAFDLPLLKKDQVVIAALDPLGEPASVQEYAKAGVSAFSLELMPRITRAQSMDILSSMATISGYKAALLAAETLPRMFPLLMTAAGTISPAKVFIVGVGVAGLQAISTARRLGAVVQAYDVRPAVKEQVLSVGAKFVEMDLDAGASEDKGGYAKAMGEEFYKKQRELMARVVAESDIVITTALIPGKKAPTLVTADAVKGMQPGSVVIDLAAERGGNCELTKADQTVVEHGVTILGPTNLPSTIPYHASQMLSKNAANFLAHLVKKGEMKLDLADEITRETLVAHAGDVQLGRIRDLLGLPSLAPPPAPAEPVAAPAAEPAKA